MRPQPAGRQRVVGRASSSCCCGVFGTSPEQGEREVSRHVTTRQFGENHTAASRTRRWRSGQALVPRLVQRAEFHRGSEPGLSERRVSVSSASWQGRNLGVSARRIAVADVD